MISGEYAVLYGAPAIVAAVDRRVTGRWTDEPQTALTPEAARTKALAEQTWGSVSGALDIDTQALFLDGAKLGLGSSAASAVVAAGAVYARQHEGLNESRQAIFECAYQGHQAVAPDGSGADVAASTFGGFIEFTMGDAPRIVELRAPSHVHWRVIYTGHPARTSDLVAQVKAFRDGAPSEFNQVMASLKAQSATLASTFLDADPRALIEAIDAYRGAMAALGKASGAPIVETHLAAIAELAQKRGGACKPSGAGGGDVALGVFESEEAANGFCADCDQAGYRHIPLELGAPGLLTEIGSGAGITP